VVEGLAHEGHSGFTIYDIDYCIQNEGKHVSLVDMRNTVQSPDEYDEMGAHPNPVAAERMAQVWYEKIMEIVGQRE